MLALSSLVFTTMLFFTTPACAGHWVFSAAGSTFTPTRTGNDSPALPNPPWSVPPDANGGITVTFPGVIAGDKQTVTSPKCTCDLTATLTITATWTHDANQDDTNDPAPTKVWLIEKSAASWSGATTGPQPVGDDGAPPPPSPFTCSGSASDGVSGDQQYYKALPLGGPYTSGTVSTPAAQAGAPPPPPGWSTQNVTGKTFTLTRTLSASGTAAYSGPYSGTCSVSMSCSLGPYSVKIHAQPYGWYDVGWFEPNGTHHDGPLINYSTYTMSFEYGWRSTSGNLPDLTGITMYEYVDYGSSPGTFSADNKIFHPQSPPIQAGYTVPNGKAGSNIDPTKLYARDDHSPFPTINGQLVGVTFTAHQTYRFDDSATGDSGTILYDAGDIIDAVQLSPNQFHIAKGIYHVDKPL